MWCKQHKTMIQFTIFLPYTIYTIDHLFQPTEIPLQMHGNGPWLRKLQTAASTRNMEPLEPTKNLGKLYII